MEIEQFLFQVGIYVATTRGSLSQRQDLYLSPNTHRVMPKPCSSPPRTNSIPSSVPTTFQAVLNTARLLNSHPHVTLPFKPTYFASSNCLSFSPPMRDIGIASFIRCRVLGRVTYDNASLAIVWETRRACEVHLPLPPFCRRLITTPTH